MKQRPGQGEGSVWRCREAVVTVGALWQSLGSFGVVWLFRVRGLWAPKPITGMAGFQVPRMYVRMYVCLYICIYVCMCMYLCMYECTHAGILCKHINMCICIHI